MCKISIIVPVYNVEKYLNKCIDSILGQTYKNFELILVNDGSTDSCLEICNSYSKIDSRIKVINKQNGGLSSARNAGLDIAKGEYISFIDSDDFINEDMYNKMIQIIEENDSDIVQCKFQKFEYEDEIYMSNKNSNYIIIDNKRALNNLYGDNRVETLVVWNKLYKKSILENIRFPIGKIHEDVYITHKILYKAKKIVSIDDILYYYRQTPDSITNSKFTLKNLDKLEALKENIKFFEEKNERDYISRAINSYVLTLEDYYFRCLEINNGNLICSNLKKEFNKYFRQFIFYKNNKLKVKIRVCIFYSNPIFYRYIKKIVKSINI